MDRVVVIYAYHEKDASYQQRLSFFLKKALREHEHVDFIFVINGYQCSVRLLEEVASTHANVTVLKRDNDGYDFGAYQHAVSYIYDILKVEYDYYFFVNASTAGPFLPTYATMSWLTPFIDLFKENSNVRLVGPTINVDRSIAKDETKDKHDRYLLPHVQTYAFMLDKQGMDYIRFLGIWSKEYPTKRDLIMSLEVGQSTVILTSPYPNWTINCLVPEYRNVDYRNLTYTFNMNSIEKAGDPVYQGDYCFGRELHPYETIFLKGNRQLQSIEKLMADESAQRLLVVIPGFGNPDWDKKVDILFKNMSTLEIAWLWKVDYIICQYTSHQQRQLPEEIRTRPNVNVIDCSGDDTPVLGNNLLRYVKPEEVYAKEYTHVMILLDDILLEKHSARWNDMVKLQKAANLDIVSPALKKEDMSFWKYMATPHARDPRVQKDPVLRIMNRCELFCYLMTPAAYEKYYQFLHPCNPWLWGTDMMLRTHMDLRVGIFQPMKMSHEPTAHKPERQKEREKEMHTYLSMHSVTHETLLLLPPDASHFYDGV